jgi:hypothetical protein
VSWKLSRTVLKPSRSGDAPAQGNQLRTISYSILLFPGWIVASTCSGTDVFASTPGLSGTSAGGFQMAVPILAEELDNFNR